MYSDVYSLRLELYITRSHTHRRSSIQQSERAHQQLIQHEWRVRARFRGERDYFVTINVPDHKQPNNTQVYTIMKYANHVECACVRPRFAPIQCGSCRRETLRHWESLVCVCVCARDWPTIHRKMRVPRSSLYIEPRANRCSRPHAHTSRNNCAIIRETREGCVAIRTHALARLQSNPNRTVRFLSIRTGQPVASVRHFSPRKTNRIALAHAQIE